MSKATCIVGQFVVQAGNEVVTRDISILALVKSLEPEDPCWSRDGGDGTLALPEHCWCVVGMTCKGTLAHIIVIHYGMMVHVAAN